MNEADRIECRLFISSDPEDNPDMDETSGEDDFIEEGDEDSNIRKGTERVSAAEHEKAAREDVTFASLDAKVKKRLDECIERNEQDYCHQKEWTEEDVNGILVPDKGGCYILVPGGRGCGDVHDEDFEELVDDGRGGRKRQRRHVTIVGASYFEATGKVINDPEYGEQRLYRGLRPGRGMLSRK